MLRFVSLAAPAVGCSVLLFLAGCQASLASQAESRPVRDDSSAKAGQASQQLIVKFKPSSAGFACDRAGIARLAAAAKVRLEYLRAMSGDACVVRHLAVDRELAPGLARMRSHAAVEWVEADSMMRAQ